MIQGIFLNSLKEPFKDHFKQKRLNTKPEKRMAPCLAKDGSQESACDRYVISSTSPLWGVGFLVSYGSMLCAERF